MTTLKFNKKLLNELIEYIELRFKKMYEKYKTSIINNDEFFAYWDDGDKKHLQFVYKTKFYILKIPNYCTSLYEQRIFLRDDYKNDELKEITVADFEWIKYCLDTIENFIINLIKTAKENEIKIQQKLEESEVYQDYKSLKVIEKLDKAEQEET